MEKLWRGNVRLRNMVLLGLVRSSFQDKAATQALAAGEAPALLRGLGSKSGGGRKRWGPQRKNEEIIKNDLSRSKSSNDSNDFKACEMNFISG
eukprot:g31250.t1